MLNNNASPYLVKLPLSLLILMMSGCASSKSNTENNTEPTPISPIVISESEFIEDDGLFDDAQFDDEPLDVASGQPVLSAGIISCIEFFRSVLRIRILRDPHHAAKKKKQPDESRSEIG